MEDNPPKFSGTRGGRGGGRGRNPQPQNQQPQSRRQSQQDEQLQQQPAATAATPVTKVKEENKQRTEERIHFMLVTTDALKESNKELFPIGSQRKKQLAKMFTPPRGVNQMNVKKTAFRNIFWDVKRTDVKSDDEGSPSDALRRSFIAKGCPPDLLDEVKTRHLQYGVLNYMFIQSKNSLLLALDASLLMRCDGRDMPKYLKNCRTRWFAAILIRLPVSPQLIAAQLLRNHARLYSEVKYDPINYYVEVKKLLSHCMGMQKALEPDGDMPLKDHYGVGWHLIRKRVLDFMQDSLRKMDGEGQKELLKDMPFCISTIQMLTTTIEEQKKLCDELWRKENAGEVCLSDGEIEKEDEEEEEDTVDQPTEMQEEEDDDYREGDSNEQQEQMEHAQQRQQVPKAINPSTGRSTLEQLLGEYKSEQTGQPGSSNLQQMQQPGSRRPQESAGTSNSFAPPLTPTSTHGSLKTIFRRDPNNRYFIDGSPSASPSISAQHLQHQQQQQQPAAPHPSQYPGPFSMPQQQHQSPAAAPPTPHQHSAFYTPPGFSGMQHPQQPQTWTGFVPAGPFSSFSSPLGQSAPQEFMPGFDRQTVANMMCLMQLMQQQTRNGDGQGTPQMQATPPQPQSTMTAPLMEGMRREREGGMDRWLNSGKKKKEEETKEMEEKKRKEKEEREEQEEKKKKMVEEEEARKKVEEERKKKEEEEKKKKEEEEKKKKEEEEKKKKEDEEKLVKEEEVEEQLKARENEIDRLAEEEDRKKEEEEKARKILEKEREKTSVVPPQQTEKNTEEGESNVVPSEPRVQQPPPPPPPPAAVDYDSDIEVVYQGPGEGKKKNAVKEESGDEVICVEERSGQKQPAPAASAAPRLLEQPQDLRTLLRAYEQVKTMGIEVSTDAQPAVNPVPIVPVVNSAMATALTPDNLADTAVKTELASQEVRGEEQTPVEATTLSKVKDEVKEEVVEEEQANEEMTARDEEEEEEAVTIERRQGGRDAAENTLNGSVGLIQVEGREEEEDEERRQMRMETMTQCSTVFSSAPAPAASVVDAAAAASAAPNIPQSQQPSLDAATEETLQQGNAAEAEDTVEEPDEEASQDTVAPIYVVLAAETPETTVVDESIDEEKKDEEEDEPPMKKIRMEEDEVSVGQKGSEEEKNTVEESEEDESMDSSDSSESSEDEDESPIVKEEVKMEEEEEIESEEDEDEEIDVETVEEEEPVAAVEKPAEEHMEEEEQEAPLPLVPIRRRSLFGPGCLEFDRTLEGKEEKEQKENGAEVDGRDCSSISSIDSSCSSLRPWICTLPPSTRTNQKKK